jgi:hypothetical protein
MKRRCCGKDQLRIRRLQFPGTSFPCWVMTWCCYPCPRARRGRACPSGRSSASESWRIRPISAVSTGQVGLRSRSAILPAGCAPSTSTTMKWLSRSSRSIRDSGKPSAAVVGAGAICGSASRATIHRQPRPFIVPPSSLRDFHLRPLGFHLRPLGYGVTSRWTSRRDRQPRLTRGVD